MTTTEDIEPPRQAERVHPGFTVVRTGATAVEQFRLFAVEHTAAPSAVLRVAVSTSALPGTELVFAYG